ncbi:MAG TPA: hypothetical protein DIW64_16120 [Cellvibrio sp.]|nr:hypothetical protein [Cellvibrio sp.]
MRFVASRHDSGAQLNKKDKNMDFFKSSYIEDSGISNAKIAQICGVTIRTAQRWRSGRTRIPSAAQELIILHVRQRVMPNKWPEHWIFNHLGLLDIGSHAPALAWQHIDWYQYSLTCWHSVLAMIPAINKRLDEIARTATTAQIIELDKYRARLRELAEHEFRLPDHLLKIYELRNYELPEPVLHRKTGC